LDTQENKKKGLFALIVTQHRLWGTVLSPYIIAKDINKSYYRLSEALSPFPSSDTMELLAPEERDTVNILNEYSERNLFRIFSKEKTVKEFVEKVTAEKIAGFIRPYIESRIYKCLTIARDEAVPVFLQKARISTIHSEDRLLLNAEQARPVFRFDRDETASTYSLSLESAGKVIKLKNSSIDIICSSPCLIRESNNIFFISDIDGAKLRPFLTKDFVSIPKKSEVKYFSSFVLNAVNNFKVEGTGFSVSEIAPVKKAILTLTTGLSGSPVLLLEFSYSGQKVFSDDTEYSFTVLNSENDNFTFTKFRRDFGWEDECTRILGELGFFSDDNRNYQPGEMPGSIQEDTYITVETINRTWSDLKAAGFELSSSLRTVNYNLQPVALTINHRLEGDWFDLKAVVTIGAFQIPFIKLRKNILEDRREYDLPDGTVAILPSEWFTRYKSLFEFGKGDDENLKIHKQHFSILSEAFTENDCVGCGKFDSLVIPEKIPLLDPPSGLNCDMRQYQVEGYSWMQWLQSENLGGCLADDMGLGKTIQTLALLQHSRENYQAVPVPDESGNLSLFGSPEGKLTSLVVVPASLVYNWENEIKRFAPDLKVYSYKGNQRRKSTSYFNYYDIILSSYHTVRQDIEILCSFRFHYVILDESQVIKNPGSMVFRTVTRLTADHRLVLTGTPVENSLTDLWTQLNFVNPGLLGTLAFFRREFAKPIEKKKDDDKENKLRKIILPFILRRTKEMVASDLPAVTEQTVFCDMTEEQAKTYEEEKSAVRNSILESTSSGGTDKSAIVVLQGLMKLRQISNHPVLANENYQSGSGKFETVLQDIQSVISEGHKILVFSSFVRHLDLFAEVLTKKRIGFSMLTGASTNREKIVNSFQKDQSVKVFLISLKAGGVGLNLTAADYVFILDPWWNPAAELQALNRAHRIGQDKSVFVYRYISSGSIEEKIVRLQEVKSKLAETFVTSSNPLKDINVEQILEILS
jgi:hypothetical protein